ncbi:NDR1/HIN1-like protein 1 [Typha latifolia]|uniref:NDR1/HIN1-like protein 1 n=1 Tax=Typha latifolia TaxID=4733 RepID=UPI003C2EA27C
MTKDCGNHGECERRKRVRQACAFFLFIVIVILLIVLIVWLTLRPTKPKFYLQDATVISINLTTPTLLTTSLQVTISSRNPNDRIGIYYNRLDIYAAYKNQQITVPNAIPPIYQGHNDVVVWSPYLSGIDVPVAPYVANSLLQDCSANFLLIHVKLDGRVRWKVGSWISGKYHLFVSCPAFLSVQGGRGDGVVPSLKFQQMSACTVDV